MARIFRRIGMIALSVIIAVVSFAAIVVAGIVQSGQPSSAPLSPPEPVLTTAQHLATPAAARHIHRRRGARTVGNRRRRRSGSLRSADQLARLQRLHGLRLASARGPGRRHGRRTRLHVRGRRVRSRAHAGSDRRPRSQSARRPGRAGRPRVHRHPVRRRRPGARHLRRIPSAGRLRHPRRDHRDLALVTNQRPRGVPPRRDVGPRRAIRAGRANHHHRRRHLRHPGNAQGHRRHGRSGRSHPRRRSRSLTPDGPSMPPRACRRSHSAPKMQESSSTPHFPGPARRSPSN